MAGEPNDPNVVAEILPAELSPKPNLLGEFEYLLFKIEVTESRPSGSSLDGQFVKVVSGGEFCGLERELGCRSSNNDGEMVRRAGGCANTLDFFFQEVEHPRFVQDRLRLLVQKRLVGATASFGHEQKLVARSLGHSDVDLCRHVVAGVGFFPQRLRRKLRVAKVEVLIGAIDAFCDVRLVVAIRQHLITSFSEDNRSPGVLAHRQNLARRDVGVFQEVQGDEFVVVRGLWVEQYRVELLEMGFPEVEVDLFEGFVAQILKRLPWDFHEILVA